MVIVYIGTGYIQVLYLGKAPRTKEALLDFHEWRRVTRHPLVFRELTGSQRTPGIGVSHIYYASKTFNEAQENYSTTKKEMLAIVFA